MSNQSHPNDQTNPAGAIPVYGASGASPASDGTVVYPDAWPSTWTYTAGLLTYQQITNPTTSVVYQQTFTYNSDGTVATRTAWVKQ